MVDPLQYQVSNPLNSDYDALATGLWEMMIRQSECVEIGEYVTMEHSLAVVEAMMGADEYEEGQYFYHPDHLGSASFITNVGGAATQHLQYLPFGESYIDQRNSSYDERFKFTGKEKDAETGFNYFGARYYDAGVSVWLSVDPMADIYSSASPFIYTLGNPVMLIDPNGMNSTDFYDIASGEHLEHVEDGIDEAIAINKYVYSALKKDGALTNKDVKEVGGISLGANLQNPGQTDHPFRCKTDTHSGAKRTVIPI